MSLQTPKITDVSDNIIAQLEAAFNQTIPLLPKSFSRVLAKVLAGVFILLYKYGGFIFLQQFVATASIKETTINGIKVKPLIELGRRVGAPDPVVATQAEFIIDITVTNQTGSLPSGSQLLNADNGVVYLTIGTVLLDAPTVQATIRASSDQTGGDGSGVVGNLNVSDTVSFANSLANVSRDATIATLVVTGADVEDTEVYRQRVGDLFKKRPQGGAYADYEQWSVEVAGIINAFPYTGNNPGQVDVYVEATVASSGDPDGIPTTAQLQAVLDNINTDQSGIARRRPAGALVNTLPITRKGFDVNVDGIVADNVANVQTQIQTAITQYFLDRSPFIDGLTVPPRRDRLARSAIIGIVNDIVTAVNGTFTTSTFAETLVGTDIESYVLQQGEKSKLGNPVTFT
jgi:uncharacterized phage protein gp47/JayE